MTDRKPKPAQLTHAEAASVAEVFESHGLTPEQEVAAREDLDRRWNETSGRFYAYNVAHQVAAAAVRNTATAASTDTPDASPAISVPGMGR